MYFCTLSVENCGAIGMPTTRVDAAAGELLERVLDERLPVAHADGDRHAGAEPRAQRLGLREREVGQRRAPADRVVVVPHLLDELGRRRPSAANEPQIFRHLVERRRRAVGHQENGGIHAEVQWLEARRFKRLESRRSAALRRSLQRSIFRTNLDPRTSRASEPRPSYSRLLRLLMNVPRDGLDVFDRRHRQDAVAEVEDVAGPAAGALEHFVGRGEDAIERREQQRRIEIALDARDRSRCASHASSSGVRQSAPITSPPASRISPRIDAGADAEVNRRHAERRERARRCGACAAG